MGAEVMADPSWNWLDPKAWLYAMCGAIGLVLGRILFLALVAVSWLMGAWEWLTGKLL